MPPAAAEPWADESAEKRARSRVLIVGVVRAMLTTVAIVGAYAVLPLDRLSDASAFVVLTASLCGFVMLLIVQLRAISRSRLPGLRAIEALATSVPTLLVIFAGTYYVMAVTSPDWFSESMSKLDSLYFTITVFATVGFGDITATAPESRAAVTLQMIVNLLVLGIGLRVILGAVQAARQRAGLPAPGSTTE
jgi:hypothetical protein